MNTNNFQNFKVLQLNCRSIKTNFLQLDQFVAENQFSVLALQSLNVESDKLPKIDSYYYPPVHDFNSAKIQTAIYVRCNLKYHILNPSPITKEDDIFHVSISVKLNNNTNINIISVYLPKGPIDDNSDWLKSSAFSNGKWLVLGDFNAHSPLWDSQCKLVSNNRFMENVIDSHLSILNDGSLTRVPDISHHKPSAIDLSFASPNLYLVTNWRVDDNNIGSDHMPIIINIREKIDYEEDDIEEI